MKTSIQLWLIIAFFAAAFSAAGAMAKPAEPVVAKAPEAKLQVASDITLSGDIDPMDFAVLYPDGVLYIDFRTAAEEGVAETRDEALRQGMRYEDIPVPGPEIDPAQVARLKELLGQRSHFQHTVLRCGSGNRAGMMWAAIRIEAGDNPDTVLEELAPIVNKEPVIEAVKTYAGSANR